MLQLVEEINPGSGTMYAVKTEESTIKWFATKETAEAFYNSVIADPTILESKRNILKSEEISLSLEQTNK
jgi:hypothetical protein